MFFKKKIKEEPVSVLKAVVSGEVIPVTEVSDEIFASKALGDGVAIHPTGHEITAPCDAVISMIADTFHAIGLTLNNGAEVLIHEGIDTVSLNGEGFEVQVKQGQKVKQGDILMKFDKDLIEKKGLSADCIILVTNSDDFPDMMLMSGGQAKQNETEICKF